MARATEILDELIELLGESPGPIERVIHEWAGAEVALAAFSAQDGDPRHMAMSVVDELGQTWGATGDPTWVAGLVPGYGDEGPELDYMFALYRRPRFYAYARLRGDDESPPAQMRLVLGVLRKPADHGQ